MEESYNLEAILKSGQFSRDWFIERAVELEDYAATVAALRGENSPEVELILNTVKLNKRIASYFI